MGNNPSTTAKPGTPASHTAQHESPKPAKRDSKHPIPVHHQRVAAPPEPSLAQAQGTTTSNNSRPKSGLQPRPIGGSHSNSPASSTPSSSVTSSKPVDAKPRPDAAKPEPTKPVAVPHTQQSPESVRSPFSDILDTPSVALGSTSDLSYLSRPPRLPLPIEQEIHTPGSPIISPADVTEALGDDDELGEEGLQRRSSVLSTDTLEEDDAEALLVDKTRPTVPTKLEWLRGGEKVYVTGTIFQWNRKTRLMPVEGRPGVFAATIHILPGTHHVRFLVDGQMQTSPDLPTTVDFGNNLVNYIEVNPDDVPAEEQDTAGAAVTGREAHTASAKPSPTLEGQDKPPRDKVVPPASQYSDKIPKYLLDFDQPEDSPLYNSAIDAIDKLQTPPSLPGFLGKPILNAATLIKDDNSVLNMPNHTVLNHLATSSIKNNILAVSATTRYKHKYVTTIIYKPTTADGS